MRMLLCQIAKSVVVLAGVSLVVAGDSQDDARALVAKSIAAIGGEAKLEKHKAITFSEKGTYYGMGDGLPYTGKYAIQFPDQFRMEIVGVFTMVLDGDKGWVGGMGGSKAMSKEQIEAQQFEHKAGWMGSLLPLKDKAFTLKMLPDAKVGKIETRVVEASRKAFPTVKLYFDKATNYLVKSEFKSKAADLGFKEVAMDVNYSDYRDVDGVKTPHKMVLNRDGKVFVEAEVTEMKAEGKLDAKVFAEPK